MSHRTDREADERRAGPDDEGAAASPPDGQPDGQPDGRRALFRAQAVQAHRRGAGPGRPLHIVATWTRWAVGVTVGVLTASLVFAVSARIGEYAEGVAVVRREGRVAVTSAVPGTVQSIAVRTGERVAAGQVLVQLDDAAPRAELARVEQEYHQRLVELLRAPADEARRERLATIKAQLQLARARVRERQIVASQAGRVSDVRTRPGQPVAPGDAVVAVEQDTARTVVIGLFPGHYRPLLSAGGSRLFLEFAGFPGSRHEVAMRSLADEVVGPAEAMRYLGRERQGALELAGPVVVVETELPSDTFVSDDAEYRVFDGMQGVLEARLRSETVLEALIPALKRL